MHEVSDVAADPKEAQDKTSDNRPPTVDRVACACPACGDPRASHTPMKRGGRHLRCPRCRTRAMLNGEHAPDLAEAWLWFANHDPGAASLREFRPTPGTYATPFRGDTEREIHCPLCLEAPARVKPDRKGDRYLSCDFCLTRMFLVDDRFWDGMDTLQAFIAEHGDWLRGRLFQALEWVRFGHEGCA